MRDEQPVHRPPEPSAWPRSILMAPVLLALLAAHFCAVGLHVCPPNPVSLAAKPWVDAYIHPYFSQSWELFAPEPGGTNDFVHIRCHRRAGQEPTVTDWIDVTTPLVRAHQRNRLGAASRMLRAARPHLVRDQEAARRAVRHMDGELARRFTQQLDAEAKAYFERGRAHLQRLASAECKRRFGPDIEQVEARRISSQVPPYGLRGASPRPPATALALPPMPYVEVSL